MASYYTRRSDAQYADVLDLRMNHQSDDVFGKVKSAKLLIRGALKRVKVAGRPPSRNRYITEIIAVRHNFGENQTHEAPRLNEAPLLTLDESATRKTNINIERDYFIMPITADWEVHNRPKGLEERLLVDSQGLLLERDWSSSRTFRRAEFISAVKYGRIENGHYTRACKATQPPTYRSQNSLRQSNNSERSSLKTSGKLLRIDR